VLLPVGGELELGWCEEIRPRMRTEQRRPRMRTEQRRPRMRTEQRRPRMRTEQRRPRFEDPGPRRNQIDRVEEDLVVARRVAFVGVFEGFAAEDKLGGAVVGVGVAAGYVQVRSMGTKEVEQMGEK
jgi:hypothetical protein